MPGFCLSGEPHAPTCLQPAEPRRFPGLVFPLPSPDLRTCPSAGARVVRAALHGAVDAQCMYEPLLASPLLLPRVPCLYHTTALPRGAATWQLAMHIYYGRASCSLALNSAGLYYFIESAGVTARQKATEASRL